MSGKHVHHRPPPHPGAEHAVGGAAGPCQVSGGEQGVDGLAGHVVVDQHLGQALGEVGSSIEDDLNAPAGAPSKMEEKPEPKAEEKAAVAAKEA